MAPIQLKFVYDQVLIGCVVKFVMERPLSY